MGSFSVMHWVIVLVVIVLLFGAKKLPELAGGIGKSIKTLKKELNSDETKAAETATPAQPAQVTAEVVTPTPVQPVQPVQTATTAQATTATAQPVQPTTATAQPTATEVKA